MTLELQNPQIKPWSAAEVVNALKEHSFTDRSIVLFGYGAMGQQYLAAAQALGVGSIEVCTRTESRLQPLKDKSIPTYSGGFEQYKQQAPKNALAIVALPILELPRAVEHLVSFGFRSILCEKPLALSSMELEALENEIRSTHTQIWVAYNRVAYPSVLEMRAHAAEEGGITSCTYDFTELTSKLSAATAPAHVMSRWGIANSMHVLSLAHHLIGLPATASTQRQGSISWHPSGRVFQGFGVSQKNIPFSYSSDWGSPGRWGVEVHTPRARYRFCPLETLSRKSEALGSYSDVPLSAFAPAVKAGFTEQLAAALSPEIRTQIPLVSLREAIELTRFAESVFGYSAS